MNRTILSLDLAEIAALIRATPQVLHAELNGLSTEVCCWHPSSGEWCINEVIGHIIEADRHGFAGRIQTILAQKKPELKTWDVQAVTNQRRDCERAVLDLLDELRVMRETSAHMITSLKPDLLMRSGIHPQVGELRIVDLIHEWVHHDRNHVKQIFSNIQAFVWPQMGNAQRFSELM